MKHIYAERLFGMAIGLFIAAILMNNSDTSYAETITVYTLVAAAIVGSLILSIWSYIEGYGKKPDEDNE